MSTPLLKVTELRAGYGRAEVLHGIDLKADKGSVITVIGPNGSGKSTLLNTLMGILPGRGRIEFDGQSIDELTLEERVMAGMALVPEKRELFGSMSVEQVRRSAFLFGTQVMPAFALGMVGVGLSASAAMSANPVTAGTAIVLTPWQRRHPLLAALVLVPRLIRQGAVR